MRADGNKISARLRIIEMRQPDRTSMVLYCIKFRFVRYCITRRGEIFFAPTLFASTKYVNLLLTLPCLFSICQMKFRGHIINVGAKKFLPPPREMNFAI